MVLGSFNTGFPSTAYYLTWVLFMISTVLNVIVLMNLLIAIISDSFARVNSNAGPASYQEMAALISENSYLVPAGKL